MPQLNRLVRRVTLVTTTSLIVLAAVASLAASVGPPSHSVTGTGFVEIDGVYFKTTIAAHQDAGGNAWGAMTSWADLSVFDLTAHLVVWVIDSQGREHHGRLTGLQDASLTVDDGAPTTFKADVIREVRRQRRDSLLNGMLIGFAAGALIGRFSYKGSRCGSDPECLLYPGTYGAVGMGLGALADAIVAGREVVVYRATGGRGAARVHLRPMLTGRTLGFGFSVSF